MTDPTPKAVVSVPELVEFMRGGAGTVSLSRELFAEIERLAKSREAKYECLTGATEKTLYSSPAATQSLLDDKGVNLFDWLCDEASDALGAQAGGTFAGDWSIQSATLLRDPYAAKPYVLFYVQAEAVATPQASLPPVEGVRAHELAERLRTAEVYDIAGAREEIGILLIDAANELDRLATMADHFGESTEKAALSPVPSGGGEPVAWRGVSDGIDAITTRADTRDDWIKYGREITPLYAAPVPAVEAGERQSAPQHVEITADDARRQPAEVLSILRASTTAEVVSVFKDGSWVREPFLDHKISALHADYLVSIPLSELQIAAPSAPGEPSPPSSDHEAMRAALEPFAEVARRYLTGGLHADLQSRAPSLINLIKAEHFYAAHAVLGDGK